jgi:acyl carrier protein
MNNSDKLLQAVAVVLRQPPGRIDATSDQDNVEGWDSMAVVNLVLELEQVFGVRFDILEIASLRSVALIKAVLSEKGIPFE